MPKYTATIVKQTKSSKANPPQLKQSSRSNIRSKSNQINTTVKNKRKLNKQIVSNSIKSQNTAAVDEIVVRAAEYMKNIQSPKELSLFPTEFSQYIHPGVANTVLPIDVGMEQQYGMLVIRPEFERTVSYYVEDDSELLIHDEPYLGLNAKLNIVKPLSFAPLFLSESPVQKVIEVSRTPSSFFNSYAEERGFQFPAITFVPGHFKSDELSVRVVHGEVFQNLWNISLNEYVDPEHYNVLWDKDFTTDPLVPTNDFTVGPVDGFNIFFAIKKNGTQEYKFETQWSIVVTPEYGRITQSITRIDYDLFDLPNMACFKSEYLLAKEYLIFAMDALLSNSTKLLDLGGIAAVAQLPEGSLIDLPVNPKQAMAYIGSLQNDAKGYLPLIDGIHATYVPKERDDTFYTKKLEGEFTEKKSNKPFVAQVFNKGQKNGALALTLSLGFGWQYVTNSLVTPTLNSHGSLEMLFHMYTHMSGKNALGSNESHITRMMNNVKRFVNDPKTRAIASGAYTAGKVIAPILLTLL